MSVSNAEILRLLSKKKGQLWSLCVVFQKKVDQLLAKIKTLIGESRGHP